MELFSDWVVDVDELDSIKMWKCMNWMDWKSGTSIRGVNLRGGEMEQRRENGWVVSIMKLGMCMAWRHGYGWVVGYNMVECAQYVGPGP